MSTSGLLNHRFLFTILGMTALLFLNGYFLRAGVCPQAPAVLRGVPTPDGGLELRVEQVRGLTRVSLPANIQDDQVASLGRVAISRSDGACHILALEPICVHLPPLVLKQSGWLQYGEAWLAPGDLYQTWRSGGFCVTALATSKLASHGRFIFLDEISREAFAANRQAIEDLGFALSDDGPRLYLAGGTALERYRSVRNSLSPDSNLLFVSEPRGRSLAFQQRLLYQLLWEAERVPGVGDPKRVSWLRVLREISLLDTPSPERAPRDWREKAAEVLAFHQVSFDDLKAWSVGEKELAPPVVFHTLGPAYVHSPELHLQRGSSTHNQEVLSLIVERVWRELETYLNSVTFSSPLLGQPPGLDLKFFGNVRGILEECGCKGSSAGGLARMVQESFLGPEGIIGGGNYYCAPWSSRFRETDLRRCSDLLASLDSQVPLAVGPLDLLAFSLYPNLASVFPWDQCTTVNVAPANHQGQACGQARVITNGGRKLGLPQCCINLAA